MKNKLINRPGYDALWLWFELSYASWITIPRVLMHEMSDEWQGKMAALLNEYEAAFPNIGDLGLNTSVVAKKNNKFVKMPEFLNNYRYPDREKIDKLKYKRQKFQ